MNVRPTRAIVDLDAILSNLDALRIHAKGRAINAVVKADAYGHGLVPVAQVLEAAGVEMLSVALVEEGITLRRAGVRTPILILSAAYGADYHLLFDHDLTPIVFDPAQLEALAASGGSRARNYHLKVDTGMSRLGLQPEALEEFLTAARRHTSLTLTGVMTHYANADDLDEATNRKQATLFAESLDSVKAAGFTPDWIHTSNSAATQSFDDGLSTMIRPGLTLFGISPIRRLEAFRPAMRWVTSPVHIKTIAAGTPVSYGGHWVASRPSRIATLPVGYADGYPRTLS
ncbi:MAG: alanine racemase, partial [Myxococcota bacterium]